MKLGTDCSWSIPVIRWCLYWTGPWTRLHVKKQKTGSFSCSLRGSLPYPGQCVAFLSQLKVLFHELTEKTFPQLLKVTASL